MKTFAQLTDVQQMQAVEYQARSIVSDQTLAADTAVAPQLKKAATAKARTAFYAEPDDQIIPLSMFTS